MSVTSINVESDESRIAAAVVRIEPAEPEAPPTSAAAVASSALLGLLVIAVLYVTTFMVPMLIGIVLAAMLKLMFAPFVEWLRGIGVPRVLSSLVVVASLPLLIGVGVTHLVDPVSGWLDEAPRTLSRIERRLLPIVSPLKDVSAAASAVESLTSLGNQSENEVRVAAPHLLDQITSSLQPVVLGVTVTIFVTFFLLASGDAFLRKLASAGQSFATRRRIVETMRRIQADVGDYLRTITIINVLLGVATTGVMWMLGVAEPIMWGVAAALSNFAPYVGAMLMIAALTLTGLATSATLGAALLPPLAYLLLTTIEGQMITPAVLGHRMSMSPVVVFLGVVFAGWLWGVAGALVAVPVLVTVKIICEDVASVRLVALLMNK